MRDHVLGAWRLTFLAWAEQTIHLLAYHCIVRTELHEEES